MDKLGYFDIDRYFKLRRCSLYTMEWVGWSYLGKLLLQWPYDTDFSVQTVLAYPSKVLCSSKAGFGNNRKLSQKRFFLLGNGMDLNSYRYVTFPGYRRFLQRTAYRLSANRMLWCIVYLEHFMRLGRPVTYDMPIIWERRNRTRECLRSPANQGSILICVWLCTVECYLTSGIWTRLFCHRGFKDPGRRGKTSLCMWWIIWAVVVRRSGPCGQVHKRASNLVNFW